MLGSWRWPGGGERSITSGEKPSIKCLAHHRPACGLGLRTVELCGLGVSDDFLHDIRHIRLIIQAEIRLREFIDPMPAQWPKLGCHERDILVVFYQCVPLAPVIGTLDCVAVLPSEEVVSGAICCRQCGHKPASALMLSAQ
jgi:hypothetical protein